MKKINSMAAAMMAVAMMVAGYSIGKANTDIGTAKVIEVPVAAAEVEEKVVTEKVIEVKTVEVEKEEETKFERLVRVLNNNGTLKCFVVFTNKGTVEKPYMKQAIWYINTYCDEQFRYDNTPDGRFQVTDERTGRAVKYDTYKVVD